MSVERLILEYLSKNKKSLKYKGVHIGFLGLPDFKYYKYQTLANRCSDLKNKGYVKENNGEYFITHKGENFLNKKVRGIFKKFSTKKTNSDSKNLLILYDVPQDKTSLRNWFRHELQKLHFIMIQRSVWVGPSPLPPDFIEYIQKIGLRDTIKIFKLAKGYNYKK